MKILNWIGSVLLLSVLAVSTTSAASVPVNHTGGPYSMSAGNTYLAFDPAGDIIVNPGPVGTIFSHSYDFDVTNAGGLSAQAFMNVTAGASSISNLTFEWLPAPGGSVTITDPLGNPNGNTSFLTHLAFGLHTLFVTGTVVGNTSIDTAYDFSIITAVPVPAAIWLFGSALVGFIGFGRRRTTLQQA